MIEQFVNADSMSCLFNEDCFAEKYPEPFRMQGTVSFRVVYREYVRYILSLPPNTAVVLMHDITQLKYLATMESPLLYLRFLGDMAFAIAKEVWYAERYKKEASVLLPSNPNLSAQKVSAVLQLFSSMNAYARSLVILLDSRGYNGLSPKITHNVNLYRLSVILYGLSQSKQAVGEVNLVYDL